MRYDQDPLLLSRRSFQRAGVAVLGAVSVGGLLEACSSSEPDPFAPAPSWEQDFSAMPGGPLDPRRWIINTGTTIPGYNQEAEALTNRPQNVRIANGMLVLEGLKEPSPYDGREYTSARIVSRQMFQLGKLEVNARLPSGPGAWPAIWLLPTTTKGLYAPQAFGIDPASDSAWAINGEIDICEALGSHPGVIRSNLYSYSAVSSRRTPTAYSTQVAVPNSSTDFNTYGVERTSGKIVFTLNGQPYHSVEKPSDDPRIWPFEQPMNLILNVALGGNYGGPIAGNGPWQMDVRTARYYPLKSQARPN